jgi:hypothetical protein
MVVPRQGKEEIIDDVLDRVLYWMPFRAEDVVADTPKIRQSGRQTVD